MRFRFRRTAAVDLGIPTTAQLLEARHVDAAVVEVPVEVGQVPVEKPAIDPDRVSAQRCDTCLRDVLGDVRQPVTPRLLQGHCRRLDRGEQARLRVHRPHDVVHLRERVLGLVHDDVDAGV